MIFRKETILVLILSLMITVTIAQAKPLVMTMNGDIKSNDGQSTTKPVYNEKIAFGTDDMDTRGVGERIHFPSLKVEKKQPPNKKCNHSDKEYGARDIKPRM